MMRIGFIGTGGISKVHLQYLASRKDVEITALCDLNRDNLDRRTKEFGGREFTDYSAMLRDTELDAVWVCTPPTARKGPLAACAEKGLPIFCEKPAAHSMEAADEISRALSGLDARIQVGYLFRSMPVVDRLREEIADDAIHTLQSLYVCPMSLKRATRDWFYDKALSGGGIVDQATHNLDLLRFLFGEVDRICGVAANPIKEKEKGYTIDETISLSLLFRNSLVASHVHSWVGNRWRNIITLSGEKGLYRLDLNSGALAIEKDNENRTFQQEDRSMFEWEDAVFLEQVSSGNWKKNPSDFSDAAGSLELTLRCNRAISV